MNKYIIILIAVIAASCGKQETAEEAQAPTVIQLSADQKERAGIVLGQLEERNMSENIACTGLVDVPPISQASVSIPISGYVKSTFELLPGKQVAKGQVLATLTSLDFIQMQQEYLQAQSQMGLLVSERSRQQVLQAEEVGSKKKFQQSEADLGNLQALSKSLALKLEILGCDMKSLAQGNISSTLTVKSPIDGYIEDQSLAIGKFVSPTDVLVKIVGVAHKHIELKVFERDLAKIKLGQAIEFNSNGSQAKGKVFLVGKQVDLSTRLTPIHGHFNSEAEEANFTIGQFVNAEIQVGTQKMLTIPQAGLARVGKGGFIYVEMSNGAMKQIPVEIRGATQERVGIIPKQALPAGQVVVQGASALEAIFAKD
jgi:cobalt-zinc-cadmium efflux system membrane fusion protein